MFESYGECGLAVRGEEYSQAGRIACKEVEKAAWITHMPPASQSRLSKAMEGKVDGSSVLSLTLPFVRGKGYRGV